MDFRNLGPNGPRISALGLGCMGMSDFYGPADRAVSIATIHAAQEAGITWLDTGDFYGMGDNELLLREALQGGRRDRSFIAVKFGAQRDPSGAFIGIDTRPGALKTALAYTLKRLGTDHVDLYQPARLDPAVPIEETVGAIADLVAAGYVRHIGLSEMSAATIRRAHATHPIASLQIEYALISRGPEAEIMPTLTELGIALNPYGVLGRGLLSGSLPSSRGDFRTHAPRFQGENLARNQALVTALAKLAAERGTTPARMAIAWVLAQGPHIIPLVGARRPDQLAEALGALELRLTPEDLAALEAAVPASAVAGTRYDAELMRMLDSERPAA